MPDVTTITANAFTWADIASTDLEDAKVFYSQIFGWEAEQVGGPEMGNYTFFKKRGKTVAGAASAMPGQPTAWTPYVAARSVDQTVEAARAAGGTIVMEPMDIPNSGRMGMLQDPTGAYISLWQAGGHSGSGISGEPGSIAWNELLTRDLPGAATFYKAVFGWDIQAMPMGEGQVDYNLWKLDGQDAGGAMDISSMLPAEVPAHWQVYFHVENVDRSAEQIAQLGGKVLMGPTDFPGGRLAVVGDRQGGTFGIMNSTE